MIYIVMQNRNSILNVDNVVQIYTEDSCIMALLFDGNMLCLGSYKDHERAKDVFSKMLKECFPPDVVVFKNMDIPEEVIGQMQKRATDLHMQNAG